MFVCCVRNPRNINIFGGCPAGRIGDRGDRDIVCVPSVYVPFLVPTCSVIYVILTASPQQDRISQKKLASAGKKCNIQAPPLLVLNK